MPQLAKEFLNTPDFPAPINLRILPYHETQKCFQYGDIKCSLGISNSINSLYGTSEIGRLTSSLLLEFGNSITPIETIKYTQKIYDFLRFLNYSSNITFSKIMLYRRNNKGKIKKYALLHIFQENTKYENNQMNSITISDIEENKIEKLFHCAVSLRDYDNKLHLYFPKNSSDRRTTNPIDWFTKALVFEGLFSKTYPNHKSETNPAFKNAKETILNNLNTVKPSKKKETEYFEKIIKHIERYDGILEEKFNFAKKRYSHLLLKILKINEEKYGIKSNENYGKVYMDYRNKIAHGDICPITDKEIAVYRLLEPMIYLMLLNDAELSEDEQKRIVHKLFE